MGGVPVDDEVLKPKGGDATEADRSGQLQPPKRDPGAEIARDPYDESLAGLSRGANTGWNRG